MCTRGGLLSIIAFAEREHVHTSKIAGRKEHNETNTKRGEHWITLLLQLI